MKVIFCCLLLVASTIAVSPPFWGGYTKYQVRVSLTNPEPVAIWDFDYFYDADQKAERYQHYPPQFDEMCGLADPPFDENVQCNVVFATDGWSYIEYPEQSWCCKCENSFGGVRYDWLQNGSKFVGEEIIDDDVLVQHWTKQGQYLNHYYCLAEDQKAYRFNELWGPNKILKQWDFHQDSFVIGQVDQSLIDPPANCQTMCGGGCPYYRK